MMVLDESPLCYSPFCLGCAGKRSDAGKRLVSFLFSEDHVTQRVRALQTPYSIRQSIL